MAHKSRNHPRRPLRKRSTFHAKGEGGVWRANRYNPILSFAPSMGGGTLEPTSLMMLQSAIIGIARNFNIFRPGGRGG